MGKEITVSGSSVVGLVGRTPHPPAAGETVKGTVFEMGLGGGGFSRGVAAHKTGADVTVVIELGQDAFVDIALNTMSEFHMDTGRALYSEAMETECTLIMMDENNSQSKIVVILGTCNTIADREVNPLESLVDRLKYLLTQLETNVSSVKHIVNIIYRKGVEVILNTAPVQPVSDELLGKTGLVILDGAETKIPTDIKVDSKGAADKAADRFFSKGAKNALITLEHRGACIDTGEKKGIIPTYRVEAVDTTGAGDAFNSGLLAALAEEKNLWKAADSANTLAALSVQKIGITPSMSARGETDAFMAANR